MRKIQTVCIDCKIIYLYLFFAWVFLLRPGTAFSQTASGPTAVETDTDPSKAKKWTGHLSYLVGYKKMDDNWAPAEDQFEYGLVDLDFQRADWPVSLAVQLLMTYSGQVPQTQGASGDYSGTYEFNLGLRKIWRPQKKIQPFLGGGLSIAGASTTEQACGYCYAQPDHDSGLGYWVGTGVYWILWENFHTGFNLQYTHVDIQLFGNDFNAGGWHFNALIGYYW